MKEEYVIGGVIVVGIIFLAGLIAIIIASIIDAWLYDNKIKKFKADLKESIKSGQPELNEIKIIAKNYDLREREIQSIFNSLLREILIGKGREFKSFKQNLISYIDQYKQEEPFRGIPSEIRIQLERLKEKLNGEPLLLEPLTIKVKELLLINQKKAKRQRTVAITSLAVGLISFVYSIIITIF